jgi:hypothetical protein
MEVVHPLVPVVELTCSSSPANMLPTALSEVLGISLSEVMKRYFDGSDEGERVRWIEDDMERKRSDEEGEDWLAGEARRRSMVLERVHRNREDDSF